MPIHFQGMTASSRFEISKAADSDDIRRFDRKSDVPKIARSSVL